MLKLLKLEANIELPQPKPSVGHIPGVGQAVTISVVKMVVVPAEPVACAEHAAPVPIPELVPVGIAGGPVGSSVTTIGVRPHVKHKEPDPVLSDPFVPLETGGCPVVTIVLMMVTVALPGRAIKN